MTGTRSRLIRQPFPVNPARERDKLVNVMTAGRRRLRLWAITWLLLQVVSLTALIPRDCCVGHRRAAAPATPACHRPAEEATTRCAVSGTCEGPMAALLAQLSSVGVLADGIEILPDLPVTTSVAPTHAAFTSRPAPPDTPPPRA